MAAFKAFKRGLPEEGVAIIIEDMARMVALFTTGPARILKLDRGTLRPGAPGDITVFDLDTEWTYDVQQSFSKSRNSPFHGRRFRGGPVATVVGGSIKWTRN